MATLSIIASNIKNGGGLELLLYLLEYLEDNCDEQVIVYVDISLKTKIKNTSKRKVIIQSGFFEKIKLFTKRIENSLYFGNLPPLRRANNSMVYLHNRYLLMSVNVLVTHSARFFIKYLSQQLYIKYFIKNVDFVACQTENIKQQFINKYNFDKVELFPFFRLCDRGLLYNTPKLYDFCYVSLAHPHKNHLNLIEACEILSKKNIPFTLALTIEDGHYELVEKIHQVNQKGVVNIVNLGLLSKQDVCKLYAQSKCLVFTSTQETFGLALVEAANMDLDVVASNLDYVYRSVKPSLVFNPNSSLDIAKKLKMYLNGNIKKSEAVINNEINKMIKFFIKENNVQR